MFKEVEARMWIDGQYDDAETEDWRMKDEIRFAETRLAQNDRWMTLKKSLTATRRTW